MNVGFIGLGKMGKPMVRHLLRAGYRVTVHNRSRVPVEELAREGAVPAFSPAEVSAASDIMLTCLTNTQSVEDVYFGPQGLIPSARPGQILVDHSTVGPATSRACAEGARAKGADFLDAPVSGGPAGAEAGTLTIMVGGNVDTFERALPVFQAYGKNIRLVGPTGVGSVIKLANQLLVAINMAGVVEAMVLGTKAGADPAVMLEVLSTSFGSSAMLTRAVPMFLQRNFTPGTPVNLILKDLGLIRELGKQETVRLLMGSLAEEIFGEARAAGYGEDDMAGLVRFLERLAGVEVVSKQA
ncbi:MAG: 2-hydroxy-3-oxopropionate reductase [Chloroflexota bacterium]